MRGLQACDTPIHHPPPTASSNSPSIATLYLQSTPQSTTCPTPAPRSRKSSPALSCRSSTSTAAATAPSPFSAARTTPHCSRSVSTAISLPTRTLVPTSSTSLLGRWAWILIARCHTPNTAGIVCNTIPRLVYFVTQYACMDPHRPLSHTSQHRRHVLQYSRGSRNTRWAYLPMLVNFVTQYVAVYRSSSSSSTTRMAATTHCTCTVTGSGSCRCEIRSNKCDQELLATGAFLMDAPPPLPLGHVGHAALVCRR